MWEPGLIKGLSLVKSVAYREFENETVKMLSAKFGESSSFLLLLYSDNTDRVVLPSEKKKFLFNRAQLVIKNETYQRRL